MDRLEGGPTPLPGHGGTSGHGGEGRRYVLARVPLTPFAEPIPGAWPANPAEVRQHVTDQLATSSQFRDLRSFSYVTLPLTACAALYAHTRVRSFLRLSPTRHASLGALCLALATPVTAMYSRDTWLREKLYDGTLAMRPPPLGVMAISAVAQVIAGCALPFVLVAIHGGVQARKLGTYSLPPVGRLGPMMHELRRGLQAWRGSARLALIGQFVLGAGLPVYLAFRYETFVRSSVLTPPINVIEGEGRILGG